MAPVGAGRIARPLEFAEDDEHLVAKHLGAGIESARRFTMGQPDVVRAKMTMTSLPFSMDQMTWSFIDMSDKGGRLALMWDNVMAAVPFLVVGG